MRNYNRPGQPVPLSEYEKAILLTLFYARRKAILLAYTVVVVLILLGGIFARPRHSSLTNSNNLPVSRSMFAETDPNAKYSGQLFLWLLSLTIIESAVIGTGIYFWFKRVLPLKRDADSGMKEKVPYVIVRKEHFQMTNKYFVAFDDPDYLHHELDAKTFYSCNEGDVLYIQRAARSKFVFDQDGRFSIL